MSNYNADSNPDLAKITQVAYGMFFFTKQDTKVDQFSTSSDLKVYHLVKKIGSNRLRVLVDPSQVPGP